MPVLFLNASLRKQKILAFSLTDKQQAAATTKIFNSF